MNFIEELLKLASKGAEKSIEEEIAKASLPVQKLFKSFQEFVETDWSELTIEDCKHVYGMSKALADSIKLLGLTKKLEEADKTENKKEEK